MLKILLSIEIVVLVAALVGLLAAQIDFPLSTRALSTQHSKRR